METRSRQLPPQRAICQLLRERYADRPTAAIAAWQVGRTQLFSWRKNQPIVVRNATLARIAEVEGLDLAQLQHGVPQSTLRVADRSGDPIARSLGKALVEEEDPGMRRRHYAARELYLNGRRASLWANDGKTTVAGAALWANTRSIALYIDSVDGPDFRLVPAEEAYKIGEELDEIYRTEHHEERTTPVSPGQRDNGGR